MKKIKFLGTAGARFVVAKQLRASAGLWIEWEGTNLMVDPGPGTLVKCFSSRPRLDPSKIDAIILTHRHIDHSTDINVMIEAMTEGGFKKRGTVFVPQDAVEEDPVILKYIRNHAEKIEILKEGKEYMVGNVVFNTPIKHLHDVETYGLNFKDKKKVILSLMSDTLYFKDLEKFYPGEILIINVVRYEEKKKIKHLSIDDVEKIIIKNKPGTTILTHFGMTMLKANPYKVAKYLEEKLKMKVIAAYDGMSFIIEG